MKTFDEYGIHVPANARANVKNEVYTTCPQCSHERKKKKQKCLSVNTEKGIWFCHHCGWKGSLRDSSNDECNYPYRRPLTAPQPAPTDKDPKLWTLPTASVEKTLNDIGHPKDTLFHFLASLWPAAHVRAIMRLYRVGFTLHQLNVPCTTYWQVDQQQRARTAKLIRYLNNGKRDHGSSDTLWMHNLYKIYLDNTGDPKDHEISEQWELRQCLYGQHLLALDDWKQRTVCIVEGQKNMLVGALWKPECIWIAAGSATALNPQKVSCLRDRDVLVFPDLDQQQTWTQLLPTLGIKHYQVCDIVPQFATPEDGINADIADIILRLQKNTLSTAA